MSGTGPTTPSRMFRKPRAMITRNIGVIARHRIVLAVRLSGRRLASTAIRPRPTGRLRALFIGSAFLTAGYTLGHKLNSADQFSREELTAAEIKELEKVEEYRYLHSHPLVLKLRRDSRFKEKRYYDEIPEQHKENMLTSGLLAGRGYLTVEPIVFANSETNEMIYFYHIGDRVEGHPGIVHGGLLATIMDEGLTRCGFPALPNKYGVTAKLDLNYKAPVHANSYVVLKSRVVEQKGRKVVVKGQLETLTAGEVPTVLVDGEVTMVEPRWAKYLLWVLK
ncbi:hypothetical protein TRVA0_018S01838 [Trichomonascus vanleenenianus]|uniref:PaaI family thioesterase n=1 Tax=Trichomonascus vanleenenianus TaxID=2268995 RepID=UPI003ECA933C